MQAVASLFVTADGSTVAEPMEKRREIPAPKPNAAPRADVDRVLKRITALGLGGVEAVEAAGFSRMTYFRLKRGDASMATVRDVEEWLLKEEAKQRKLGVPSKDENAALLQEWSELGEMLLSADAAQFRTTIDGLRDVLESVKLRQRAFAKMFRATPEE